MSTSTKSPKLGSKSIQVVAITGANGFIASHIVKELLQRGYQVSSGHVEINLYTNKVSICSCNVFGYKFSLDILYYMYITIYIYIYNCVMNILPYNIYIYIMMVLMGLIA